MWESEKFIALHVPGMDLIRSQDEVRQQRTYPLNKEEIMRERRHYLLSLVLAAAFIVALGARADNVETNSFHPVISTDLAYAEVGDLPNFHEVHNFLYRGARPTQAGLEKLKTMGVKTIIDLRASKIEVEPEEIIAKRMGFQTINLPMTSQAPTHKEIETFIATVENAEKTNSPVFVHCAHGADRTGCMVGIWRVSHDGWSYDKAYEEMRKYNFKPKYVLLSNTVKEYAGKALPQTAGK
jgi:protein-tyrosine phosphatase